MRYVIEDGQFTYSVDWTKLDTVEGGWLKEYYPTPKESIEALMRLLANIYTPKDISDALAGGLDAMDYSEAGWEAQKRLRELGKKGET